MGFNGEPGQKKSLRLSPEQALARARKWCAFQERCYQETRTKLYDWGIHGDTSEQIITQLISEGFLNEERFAKAFAGGKFRIKKWGRRKIVQELKKKNISEPCIRRGLTAIDEDEYKSTLEILMAKRSREVKETHPWRRRAKIINFLIAKGYEPEIVNEVFIETMGRTK